MWKESVCEQEWFPWADWFLLAINTRILVTFNTDSFHAIILNPSWVKAMTIQWSPLKCRASLMTSNTTLTQTEGTGSVLEMSFPVYINLCEISAISWPECRHTIMFNFSNTLCTVHPAQLLVLCACCHLHNTAKRKQLCSKRHPVTNVSKQLPDTKCRKCSFRKGILSQAKQNVSPNTFWFHSQDLPSSLH